jgi:thioredoxin 2
MVSHSAYTLRCQSCGTKNRIPRPKAGQTAKCGKCGDSMDTRALLTEAPVEVADFDFDAQVLNSPLPVLLDCWAPWCGPCKMVGPIMEDLALKWKGQVRVGKLNVDENPQVSSRFQIRSIPTLLIFDNGELRETLVGALPKQQIIKAMSPFLS